MVGRGLRELVMRALRPERMKFNRSWFEWELKDLEGNLLERSSRLNTLETRAKYVAAHLYSRGSLDACTGFPVYAGGGAYVPTNIVDPDSYWTKPMCMGIADTVGPSIVVSRVHERGILTGVDQKTAYFKSTFDASEGNWAPNYINKLWIGSAEILHCQYEDDIGAGPPSYWDLATDYAEIEAVLYVFGGTGEDRYRFLERGKDYDPHVANLLEKDRVDLPDGNGVIDANEKLLFIYWALPATITTATNSIAYKNLTDEIAKTVAMKLTVAWYVEFT